MSATLSSSFKGLSVASAIAWSNGTSSLANFRPFLSSFTMTLRLSLSSETNDTHPRSLRRSATPRVVAGSIAARRPNVVREHGLWSINTINAAACTEVKFGIGTCF